MIVKIFFSTIDNTYQDIDRAKLLKKKTVTSKREALLEKRARFDEMYWLISKY